jgi:hypothetical protein
MEKERAEIVRFAEKHDNVQSLMRYVNQDTLKEMYGKQPKTRIMPYG